MNDQQVQPPQPPAMPQPEIPAPAFAPPAPQPPAPQAANDWQHPGLPFDTPASVTNDSVVTPSGSSTDASANDLIDLKQQALQQLTPLIGHLEQSPEEKFRTTMMMIQASDDQSLIKSAYDAANAISDEKARAQALLDIVNEINYFTQHKN